MDSNTFAILVLGFLTIIIVVVIWQVFSAIRARSAPSQAGFVGLLDEQQQQLDARLNALVDDVQTLQRRVADLEGAAPSSP